MSRFRSEAESVWLRLSGLGVLGCGRDSVDLVLRLSRVSESSQKLRRVSVLGEGIDGVESGSHLSQVSESGPSGEASYTKK